MPSPTALSLDLLRRCGHVADVVERYLAAVQRKHDCFGFGDILACRKAELGALLVQATSLPHVGDRLKRAKGRPELSAWLASGNRFEVWGWAKRAGRWRVKRVAVRPGDLQGVVVEAPARRAGGKGHHQTELFA